MKAKIERFKAAKVVGLALGLSEVEMELIRQKKRIPVSLSDVVGDVYASGRTFPAATTDAKQIRCGEPHGSAVCAEWCPA